MMRNVCQILFNHVEAAEKYIGTPTSGALLFDERLYGRKEWEINSVSGLSTTMPLFVYTLEKIETEEKDANVD